MQPINPDVLILGGGVAGLWLLNDLRRHGYSTLLAEKRELGGEQTCHSHVYIHQGHLYREGQVHLIDHLHEVNELWSEWFADCIPVREAKASYFGFANPGDAQQKENLWKLAGLNYERVGQREIPESLKGGCVKRVLKSFEVCLNGTALVRALSQNLDALITRIDKVEAIRSDPSRAHEVQLSVQGKPVIVHPKALVLAAGAGNQTLLTLASGGSRAMLGVVSGAQQVRKAHMLVVEGQRGALTKLTGVFQPGGLFIVSRTRGNSIIWLISDDRSPLLSFVEDWMEYDAEQWLPQVVDLLVQLAPRHFTHPDRLKWGVYPAPKAEGRAAAANLPSEGRVEKFRFDNLWAVWPTKLTLAPKVSADVRQGIAKEIGPPTHRNRAVRSWEEFHVPVCIARERWKKTPRVPWKEFCVEYKL